MRRLSGVLLAGAIMLLPALSPGSGNVYAQQGPEKTTFTGDMVLWAFAVPPDKTAEYDQVVARLKESLTKLNRSDQLAGWKVMKNATPQPTGEVVYVHVINPVIPDADYSITNIVYEAFPDPAERNAFYEQYRGAVKAALFMIQGPLTADLAK